MMCVVRVWEVSMLERCFDTEIAPYRPNYPLEARTRSSKSSKYMDDGAPVFSILARVCLSSEPCALKAQARCDLAVEMTTSYM